ncbi:hypothetical protein PCANC_20894 [Puccinia coronata f. sp. avenae]|uniref:Uncharacterized protein n=1 Tax=Puccinia coronata f. sp. avenae TaxID=200324 RepID=A0A2N5SMA1_9BASI|nr:hypothetical protein PCANC_20894 [Puccinia coronata f. sp. avenae]PLW52005.1 hypothetical protein PCASD_02159 [Puccinia coronata f. sp. avenae]
MLKDGGKVKPGEEWTALNTAPSPLGAWFALLESVVASQRRQSESLGKSSLNVDAH